VHSHASVSEALQNREIFVGRAARRRKAGACEIAGIVVWRDGHPGIEEDAAVRFGAEEADRSAEAFQNIDSRLPARRNALPSIPRQANAG